MKAVISPCELLARRTVLDAWCVWYWAGASSAHLCCPSETTTGTGFLVPEEQNWWNRACSQSLPLIFSLLNDRHLTWISMSKDIVLVLLRRHCFISGLCGWFQPSLSWWQLTHNSEITVHSFIWVIITDIYNHIKETWRDQHILMQTVSSFWHRRKVNLSSASPIIWFLPVPKSICPRQSANGQELVVFSRCKLIIPSSLSSHLVIEPVNTGCQLKHWQAQSLLLGVSFCGSCYWLKVLWLSMFFPDEERPSVTFPTRCKKANFSC